ncbi:male-specific sperm protein Mst84Db-like [Plodia interpunctella]|uniref:male-specific sperm protein Mst84Db-like n=1 Tax=Plodia interpunctella TaxID=58824 RepID=UPI0023686405|nr:male-specific sperm protein Mst84Db-like [Plodia interpunctella]
MPLRNCCVGCQGPMTGPCGPKAYRCNPNDGAGPCCCHSSWKCCSSPCGDVGDVGHGARGGVAGSYFSCGHACIGGCTSGLCGSCCGPACGS